MLFVQHLYTVNLYDPLTKVGLAIILIADPILMYERAVNNILHFAVHVVALISIKPADVNELKLEVRV